VSAVRQISGYVASRGSPTGAIHSLLLCDIASAGVQSPEVT
jgi:hypothetical protein